jgi:hypothetical protein
LEAPVTIGSFGRGTVLLLVAGAVAGCSDYGFGVKAGSASPTSPSTTATTPTEPDPDDPEDLGLLDGHFDADTSAFLSPIDVGTTDGHIHEYDDVFAVAGVDFLAPLHPELQALPDLVEDPQLELVLVVINPDLSPDARLVLEGAYDPADPATWTPIGEYGDTPVQDLPTFTIGELDLLQVWFPTNAIPQGGLVGSETACVRNNTLGPQGEWRNGALTLQVADANRLQVDASLSVGGHGVAVEGLLWEGLLFWHWDGTCR